MNIYLFNQARRLSLEKVDKFSLLFQCVDLEHELPLVTGLDNDSNIYLWCLVCNYRRTIGLKTYEELIKYEGVSFEN